MMQRYLGGRAASSDITTEPHDLYASSVDFDAPMDLHIRRRELPWTRLDAALQRYDVSDFHAILGSLSASQRPAVCRFAEVQGQTLLLRACMAGCAEIVRMLLAEGADPSRLYRFPSGGPLHAAIRAALETPLRPPATGRGSSGTHASRGDAILVTPPRSSDGSVDFGGDGLGGSSSSPADRPEAPGQPDYVATVAFLLQAGADPFLENAEGLHCLDLLAGSSSHSRSSSISGGSGAGRRGCFWPSRLLPALLGGGRRSASHARLRNALVLRLQAAAPFCGMLSLQHKPFTTPDWGLMWVAVLPRRYSQPYGSAPKARSHELWVMCGQGEARPLFRAELDGCIMAREEGALRLQLLPSAHGGPPASARTFMRSSSGICDGGRGERWLVSMGPSPGELASSGPASTPSPEQAFGVFVAACRACSDGGSGTREGGTRGGGTQGGGTQGGGTQGGGTQGGISATSWGAEGRSVAAAAASSYPAPAPTYPGGYSALAPTYPGGYSALAPTYPGGGRMILPIALAMAAGLPSPPPPSREQLLRQADEAAAQLGLMRGAGQAESDGADAVWPDRTRTAPQGSTPPATDAVWPDRTRTAPQGSTPPATAAVAETAAGITSEAAAAWEATAADKADSSVPAAGSSIITAAAAEPQVITAPVGPLAATVAAAIPGEHQGDPTCCAVCLVAGASELLGLRHGRSVHRCVCYPCARLLLSGGRGGGRKCGGRSMTAAGGSTGVSSNTVGGSTAAAGVRCPLCRQPVEEILAVF